VFTSCGMRRTGGPRLLTRRRHRLPWHVWSAFHAASYHRMCTAHSLRGYTLSTSPPPTGLPQTGFTLATRFSLLRCAQAGQGFPCRRVVAPIVFSSYFPATMHVL
jgi:hypothetical protein